MATVSAPMPGVLVAFTRGLAIFRPLALAYAGVLAWVHRADMIRPSAAIATFAVLAIWSMIASWRRTITLRMAAIDLTLASAGIAATSLAYPRATVVAGALTLPGIWSSSGVVAAAIAGGTRWGIVGATVISLADLASVITPNFGTIHNIVLLYLLGALIGLSTSLARESQRLFEISVRAQEAYAERERLARIVHDGVLQTLAYVHRRGTEIGGETAELGILAADQERSLRALVSGRATPTAAATDMDIAAWLHTLAAPGITVSAPAEAVTMPSARAREIQAAVEGALENVRRHAGPEARTWILLEDLGDQVSLTIRDNGAGMPSGRLAEAAAEGRLGIASSIHGRLVDLGGTATWDSAPGRGCTVTLRAPKDLEPLARPAARPDSARTTALREARRAGIPAPIPKEER
ncbi:MacS family sensor histidine kinase [Nostocoides vanveenii]|uniref:DUF5931 domain-containing protein n=1 Tax=Nostocoides vanveenii TaxID=330835 RepID=A0ABN2K285_9MICO